jgi:hypothetical protein
MHPIPMKPVHYGTAFTLTVPEVWTDKRFPDYLEFSTPSGAVISATAYHRGRGKLARFAALRFGALQGFCPHASRPRRFRSRQARIILRHFTGTWPGEKRPTCLVVACAQAGDSFVSMTITTTLSDWTRHHRTYEQVIRSLQPVRGLVLPPELAGLLKMLLSRAKRLLSAKGGFEPFGGTLSGRGQLSRPVAQADLGGAASPDPIRGAKQLFAREVRLGALRAAGLCLNMSKAPRKQAGKTGAGLAAATDKKSTNGICVIIEHQSEGTISVFVPYRQVKSGDVEYGDPIASRGAPRFGKRSGGS